MKKQTLKQKKEALKSSPKPTKPATKVTQQQAAPQITNEQYMLQVMTDRCKQLEMTILKLAQEMAALKGKKGDKK
jgi:hypothetical protein